MTNRDRKPKAAFVGFGEVNTPREFIDDRCATAADELRKAGIDVIEAPIVSDDPAGSQADAAVAFLDANSFDALVLCVAGWIPSWAVIRVADACRHLPVVLWGLSGWEEGERFITTADQAGTTALRKPLADMGYCFKYVVNFRGRRSRAPEVASYCRAAGASARLRQARIGMAGYRDMRLYGTTYDPAKLKAVTGVEIEHFDLLELQQLMEKVTTEQTEELVAFIRDNWELVREPQAATLEQSVRLCAAIRTKLNEERYDGFSYNDVDGIKKLLGFAPAGAMTLLHQLETVSSVPENDSLGAVTQLMVRSLTGQIGAYLEFYEFMQDGAMMGVPDYVPAEIVDGRVTVMPNAFGDFGEGLLNVSKLKTGPVTLARLSTSGSEYIMHLTTGTARKPIAWEEAGWAPPAPQLPSLDIEFDTPATDFLDKVLGQHYILCYGNNTAVLEDLCGILGIQVLN